MAGLQFAESHNMVANLEKSTKNADFAEIVDFLRAHPIRYALTVNPTISVSYIKQFWSTATTKTINGVTQIHAKVNGKKIVITESSVRRDLHFNDVDGIDCLTNTEIFENLQLMGYERLSDKLTFYKPFFSHQWRYLIHTILHCLSPKKTGWNEFTTNIASAIICLATNKKFIFSKMIFDGMTRNLDSPTKFLMYPRFLQLFLNTQIENLSELDHVYTAPSHGKKIFTFMRKQGKDFSGNVTPLFPTMLTQQAEVGEGSGQPTRSQRTSTSAQPSNEEQIPVTSSQPPQKTQKPKKTKRKVTELLQTSEPSVPQMRLSLRSGKTVWKGAATTAASLEAEQDNGSQPPQRTQKPKKTKRKVTELLQTSEPSVPQMRLSLRSGKTVWKGAATTAASLEAEQDNGNINRTQTKATLNEPTPQGTGSGSGPRRQDTMGDTIAQTRSERVSTHSYDSPLGGVNTPRSDKDRIDLNELMEMCTKLSERVLDLEKTKTAQALEITNLKKRVERMERKRKSRTPQLKRRLFKANTISSSLGDQEDASVQARKIQEIDQDADVTLVDETQGRYGDDLVFNGEPQVSTAAGEVVTTTNVSVSTAIPTRPTRPVEDTTADELTLIQVLMDIKSTTTPKLKGVVFHEQSELPPRRTTVQTRAKGSKDKDKGKAIMLEPEKPMKKRKTRSVLMRK